MEISELQNIALKNRHSKEIGISLLIASLILGIFLFVPLNGRADMGGEVEPVAALPSGFDTAPALEAKAAVVYDLTTGEVLYEKNGTAQLPLASLTKLLTVYAALSTHTDTEEIRISRETDGVEAPHGLPVGETFAFADIARLTLTGSLNDGAALLAGSLAREHSVEQGALLSAAAASLGLQQTYALNGSGLDVNSSISGGYGSALDLAKLAGALVARAPAIALATTENTVTATAKSGRRVTVKNTDPFVDSIPRLLLSKTGFTDLAGGNLALVFDAGINHPIAIVVLGSTKTARFTDGMTLVAATLAHFAHVSAI